MNMNVIREELENEICKLTGLTLEQLHKMDIGDIERRMNIKHFSCGPSDLYRCIGPAESKRREEIITKLLNR
jgi:hypothetical protein